jgi:hypothetical protein
MRGIFNASGLKVTVMCLGLAFSFGASSVKAQIVTLSDNNSVALVNVGNQQGMFNWSVQGMNQLHQQWFWYSVGATAPASVDTISPATLTLDNGTRGLSSTYGNAAFSVQIDYLLSGGAVVPQGSTAVSDISETIRIKNNSASVLPFRFYQYSDFDLGGPGNDTVQLGTNLRGQYNDAVQQDPNAGLTETVTTPGASEGEVDYFANTLNKLNNGVAPVTLGNANGPGPVGPGNVTWALEWDFNIAPGSTALISKDKSLTVLIPTVPEPSAVVLSVLGFAGLAWRRCQAKSS